MGKIGSCLFITIIFTFVLIQTCSSSPTPKPKTGAEKKPRYLLLANNNDNSEYPSPSNEDYMGGVTNKPNVVAIPFQSGTILNDDGSHVGDLTPDDDMETAENIVFRPLFRYKKQNVERRTVYRDRNGNISSQTERSKPQYVTQSPVQSAGRHPPSVLVYDKVTGSYYPIPSSFGSQYPGSFPAYFRNSRN